MISWLSFTTSKVLPTFVGDFSRSYSASESGSSPAGFDYRGAFYGDITRSASASESINETQTLRAIGYYFFTVGLYKILSDGSSNQYRGDELTHYERTGQTQGGLPALESTTSVVGRSTIISNPFMTYGESGEEGVSTFATTYTAPLATVQQPTTTVQDYQIAQRTTKTISNDTREDADGNTYSKPLKGYVWATTLVDITNPNGETTQIPSVSQVTTKTTETVGHIVAVTTERIVTSTTGGNLTFETYTHPGGDVIVIAHTIWEDISLYKANYSPFAFIATVNSPVADIVISDLSFTPGRFTMSYSEIYIATLPVRADSASTISVTTRETPKTGHNTTRVGFGNETYRGWGLSYETRTCANRTGSTIYTITDDEGDTSEETEYDGVNRRVPVSYQNNRTTSFIESTQVDTTTTTSETYNGFETQIVSAGYTTGIGFDENGPRADRTRTFYVPNTVSSETTTFRLSGNLVSGFSRSWPGLSDKNVFPWSSFGEGARSNYSMPNEATTLVSTTSYGVTYQNTWHIINEQTTEGIPNEDFQGAGKGKTIHENKRAGVFYAKTPSYALVNQNRPSDTVVQAINWDGLASPDLTYDTENTHSTVGVFMKANAQHTWEGGQNAFGNLIGIEAGWISRNIVGAVPLYPTFSGLISRDSEGWELCDSSEYTTVRGSRAGRQFSTTIAWQTVEGTITSNSTSSGSFTIESAQSIEIGVHVFGFVTVAGGFETPNAARTVIVSPGALLTTTYDASGSGVGSTLLSTGTTYESAPIGPSPITLSSFLPRIRGYGVYTQLLLDDGRL
jgi:hypothetical protein